ncbi:hypothetical protein [Chengkuizengella axinellae]|uniref:DUF4352 domain-containing protein n=1 Tax=Chengkuizengella axinellae TaxID=3064388 RepID=A0ABT9IWD0_9BACL|nr:hypothetical protein [Chengkuizengella sp. 2205SS18-9]MDP5273666.1 hypothetical protein [Chengkuizengella sp. 2205SS18-9]
MSVSEKVNMRDWSFELSSRERVHGAKILNDDGTKPVYAENETYYLSFIFLMENNDKRPIEIKGDKFKLIDEDGNTYVPISAYDIENWENEPGIESIVINPNMNKNTSFLFNLPDGINNVRVKYDGSNTALFLGEYEIYNKQSEYWD